ncbi:hypothetical protein ACFV7Q_20415 [Streptomyces sp. NPDC059851]|uniref:hypothetical protein n=1 Tax=Streptomyces sp. NPDC059851 TaxID=3346971 RepID=UPI00364D4EC0
MHRGLLEPVPGDATGVLRRPRRPHLVHHRAPPTGRGRVVVGASVRATASELVLFVYDRIRAASVWIGGDAGLLDLLRARDPEE